MIVEVGSRRTADHSSTVMAGLDPAIYLVYPARFVNMDARIKSGHDEKVNCSALILSLSKERAPSCFDTRTMGQMEMAL